MDEQFYSPQSTVLGRSGDVCVWMNKVTHHNRQFWGGVVMCVWMNNVTHHNRQFWGRVVMCVCVDEQCYSPQSTVLGRSGDVCVCG